MPLSMGCTFGNSKLGDSMLTRSELVGVVYDPEQWHYRAQQMRLLATATTDPVAKSMMLLIGDGFEALSERAAERKRLFPKELSLRPHGVGNDYRARGS
jgi:hypothetical protein